MARVTSSPAVPGSLLRLSGSVRLDGLWLGPGAAALAGVIASEAMTWRSSDLLRLALLLLLAEVGWGGLWWATAGTDWATLRQAWQARASQLPTGEMAETARAPYSQPGSPSGRLATWWCELRDWANDELVPQRGAQLGAILLGLALALVISAVLGPSILLLTLGAVALSQHALFVGPADGRSNPLVQALVEAAVPWLGAVLVFGRLDWPSLTVPLGMLLGYAGLIWIGRDRRGGVSLAAGHVILVLIVSGLEQPLAAALIGGLYLSQLALLPWLARADDDSQSAGGLSGRAAVRLAQWPFLAAWLVTALAL